jgi:hypothetical protein
MSSRKRLTVVEVDIWRRHQLFAVESRRCDTHNQDQTSNTSTTPSQKPVTHLPPLSHRQLPSPPDQGTFVHPELGVDLPLHILIRRVLQTTQQKAVEARSIGGIYRGGTLGSLLRHQHPMSPTARTSNRKCDSLPNGRFQARKASLTCIFPGITPPLLQRTTFLPGSHPLLRFVSRHSEARGRGRKVD